MTSKNNQTTHGARPAIDVDRLESNDAQLDGVRHLIDVAAAELVREAKLAGPEAEHVAQRCGRTLGAAIALIGCVRRDLRDNIEGQKPAGACGCKNRKAAANG